MKNFRVVKFRGGGALRLVDIGFRAEGLLAKLGTPISLKKIPLKRQFILLQKSHRHY